MSRLPPTTFRKLDRILRRLGFARLPDRGKGSHAVYHHPDGRTTTVPDHRGKDIGSELILDILREIGLSRDEYLNLRRKR